MEEASPDTLDALESPLDNLTKNICDYNRFTDAFSKYDKTDLVLSPPYALFELCTRRNSLEVFRFLLEQKKKQEKKQQVLVFNKCLLFRVAVQENSLDVLEFILKAVNALEKPRMLSVDIDGYGAFSIAVDTENISLLRLLFSHIPTTRLSEMTDSIGGIPIVLYACKKQRFKILNELWSESYNDMNYAGEAILVECFQYAIESHDSSLLNYMLTVPGSKVFIEARKRIIMSHDRIDLFAFTSKFHYFDMFEMLLQYLQSQPDLNFDEELCSLIFMKLADISVYFEGVLDWVFKLQQFDLRRIFQYCLSGGYTKLFTMIMQSQTRKLTKPHICKLHIEAFSIACGVSVSLMKEIVAYKHQYYSDKLKSEMFQHESYKCFRSAISSKQVDTVALLITIGKRGNFLYKMIEAVDFLAVTRVIEVNSLDILKMLCQAYKKRILLLVVHQKYQFFRQMVMLQQTNMMEYFLQLTFHCHSTISGNDITNLMNFNATLDTMMKKEKKEVKQADSDEDNSSEEEDYDDDEEDKNNRQNDLLVFAMISAGKKEKFDILLECNTLDTLRVLCNALSWKTLYDLSIVQHDNMFHEMLEKFLTEGRYDIVKYVINLFSYRKIAKDEEDSIQAPGKCINISYLLNMESKHLEEISATSVDLEDFEDDIALINKRRNYQRKLFASSLFYDSLWSFWVSNKNLNIINEKSFLNLFTCIFESGSNPEEYVYLLNNIANVVVHDGKSFVSFWNQILCFAFENHAYTTVRHIITYFTSTAEYITYHIGYPLLEEKKYLLFQKAIDHGALDMMNFLLQQYDANKRGKMIHGGGKLYLLKASIQPKMCSFLLEESIPFFLYIEDQFDSAQIPIIFPFVISKIQWMVQESTLQPNNQANILFAMALLRYCLRCNPTFISADNINSNDFSASISQSHCSSMQTESSSAHIAMTKELFVQFLNIPSFSNYLSTSIPYTILSKLLTMIYARLVTDYPGNFEAENYVNNTFALSALASCSPIFNAEYCAWKYVNNSSTTFTNVNDAVNLANVFVIEEFQQIIDKLPHETYEVNIVRNGEEHLMFQQAIKRKDFTFVKFYCERYFSKIIEDLYSNQHLSSSMYQLICQEILSPELLLHYALQLTKPKHFIIFIRFHENLLFQKMVAKCVTHGMFSMLDSVKQACGIQDNTLEEMLFFGMLSAIEIKNPTIAQTIIEYLMRLVNKRSNKNILQRFIFQEHHKLIYAAISANQLLIFQKLIGLSAKEVSTDVIIQLLFRAVENNASETLNYLLDKYDVYHDPTLRAGLIMVSLQHKQFHLVKGLTDQLFKKEKMEVHMLINENMFKFHTFFAENILGPIIVQNNVVAVEWLFRHQIIQHYNCFASSDSNRSRDTTKYSVENSLKYKLLQLACEHHSANLIKFILYEQEDAKFTVDAYLQGQQYRLVDKAFESETAEAAEALLPSWTYKNNEILRNKVLLGFAKYYDFHKFQSFAMTNLDITEDSIPALIRTIAEPLCEILVCFKRYDFLRCIWSFLATEMKRTIFLRKIEITHSTPAILRSSIDVHFPLFICNLIKDNVADLVESLTKDATLDRNHLCQSAAINCEQYSILKYFAKHHKLHFDYDPDNVVTYSKNHSLLTVLGQVNSLEMIIFLQDLWKEPFPIGLWIFVCLSREKLLLLQDVLRHFSKDFQQLQSVDGNSNQIHLFAVLWLTVLQTNKLDLIQWLYANILPKKQLQRIMKWNSYFVFREMLTKCTHFSIFQYFVDHSPDVEEMFAASSNDAFLKVLLHHPIEWAEYCLEHLSVNCQDRIIGDRSCHAFVTTVDEKKRLLLLQHSYTCVSFLFAHRHEYRDILLSYCLSQYDFIRQLQRDAERDHPNIVFNLETQHQKVSCYYMLFTFLHERHDNHRNHALQLPPHNYLEHIRYLVQLPCMVILLIQGMENWYVGDSWRRNIRHAFLCKVLEFDDREVQSILFIFPSMRQAAEEIIRARAADRTTRRRDNEVSNNLLHQLATYRESSMVQLTDGENYRLQKLTAQYEPYITARGLDNVLQEFIKKLEVEYEENPACIDIVMRKSSSSSIHRAAGKDDKSNILQLALPLQWNDFQQTIVRPYKFYQSTDHSFAIPYYQHAVHSAWRYLQKPNAWMAKNAYFVNRDEQNNGWSSFEQYIKLIVLFYVAVEDTTVPSIEGHTVESRWNHFVREIALINRAHNWDESRGRKDGKGVEEYDDLEGDKPSCYGGVKRRLFQSVLGHPSLFILTKDTIQLEIRSFIRDWYVDYLHKFPGKKALLFQIIETYIVDLECNEDAALELKMLDISSADIQQFIDTLRTKYGVENMELEFIQQIEHHFVLEKKDPPCQVLKFLGQVGLYELLQAD